MMDIKKVKRLWVVNLQQNKESAEELHKPIIRKFEKQKIHSSFIDRIWCADLADMQLLNKFNNRIKLNKIKRMK